MNIMNELDKAKQLLLRANCAFAGESIKVWLEEIPFILSAWMFWEDWSEPTVLHELEFSDISTPVGSFMKAVLPDLCECLVWEGKTLYRT
jgi:hypothetical protein